MKCKNCGSENIKTGIELGNSELNGKLGLKYETKHTMGVVQVYSDVCLDCGEIQRSYIKDVKKFNK